jgi:aminoglycoside 2''-phosphotransferase
VKKELLEKYFPIIKKHFPNCQEESITFFDNGYDHFVFVIDGKHVLRFPRSPLHGKQDAIISEFSQLFAPFSPIPVQTMTSHVDEETNIKYQTYEFVSGVPLTPELAKELTGAELTELAKDVGKFLLALHSYSIEKVKHLGIESLVSPQDYADYFTDVIDVDKNVMNDLLTEEEWKWFEQIVKKFSTVSYKHPYQFTITHSDMLAEHILIDEKKHRLSGIIDFTLRIADPANDFKYFDRYGKAFLKNVYDTYLPVDEYFDERRKFYAGDLVVANVYQAVERHDILKQERYLKELKDYIAHNP